MATATSGRPFAALALAVALAVLGTGCTARPAPSAPPAPPAPSSRFETVKLCFAPPPTGWSIGTTATVEGAFGAHAVDGDVVFGQTTGTGVTSVDLTSGQAATLARYAPGVSGLGALAAQDPWVVWEQLNSQTNLSDWSVHALNRTTGATVELATARLPGGGFVTGQQPLPVLRDGIAAWTQPVKAGAELKAVELATGRSRVLDTGRISSPVYAGPYLIWAKMDGTGTYAMRAVDAKTLEPVELPEPLRRPDSVGYLGGSADHLAWSSHDASTVDVWRFGTGGRTRYTTDNRHPFQFLQFAGGFLLWYGGISSSVLDLRTGTAFDVPGTVTGSADWIVGATPAAASGATRVSRMAVGAVTPPACERR